MQILIRQNTSGNNILNKKRNDMAAKKKLKTVSLDTMIDKHIGKVGTSARDAFEQELKLDLLGYAIKEARLHPKANPQSNE